MSVKKAVIPCGGFGTRFLPATKVIPKEILPIVDRPALCYIIDEAVASGIKEILIVMSKGKESIRALFEPNIRLNEHLKKRKREDLLEIINRSCGADVKFVYQPEQKGSGDAVRLAKEFAADEPFAVLFGDDVMYTGDDMPVTAQLLDAYNKTGKTVVGVQKAPLDVARRCGVMILCGEESDITPISGIIEKPKDKLPSDLVSLGRFILTPDIFDALDKVPLSSDGEIYLTDAISLIAREKGAVACNFKGRRYDIGNKEGYLEATVEYALRDPKLGSEFDAYLKRIKRD